MADALHDIPISRKIASLADSVFALSGQEAEELQRTLTSRRMERDRAAAERIARLRAMDDAQVIYEFIQIAQPDADEILGILRDAGFVRLAGLEAAYRAGFEASGEGWNGEHPGNSTDDVRFVDRMQDDLEIILNQQREGA